MIRILRTWRTTLVLALVLAAALALPKCEGKGPHPFAHVASTTAVQKPPMSFVVVFTQAPRRLEPMECQQSSGLSPLYQGLRVWVCVPYFLSGHP